ncbi:MAG TPA: PGPGW domain-containing protein [Candidatus Saccharimonadales bacterium]|jgi:uncharacterized protein (TIGR02611 family)|nr:PGPGW domain-containing protein [Candidatus Saccharimonadales bacterium]
MERFKRVWYGVPKAIRKPLVLMVGTAVVIAGLAMLVLPGPGWASIFLGFAILATEFAVARRVRDWLIGLLRRSIAALLRAWRHLIRKQ